MQVLCGYCTTLSSANLVAWFMVLPCIVKLATFVLFLRPLPNPISVRCQHKYSQRIRRPSARVSCSPASPVIGEKVMLTSFAGHRREYQALQLCQTQFQLCSYEMSTVDMSETVVLLNDASLYKLLFRSHASES